jgi:hypothetical protein
MSIPQSLTREEAKRQIAELERHIASLPTNNHPEYVSLGMLFKHNDGSVFMVCGDKELLYCVQKGCDQDSSAGLVYSSESTFGARGKGKFTYLGHARDLLKLTTDKPSEVVVTDEMFQRAERVYWDSALNAEESRRHVLTLALNGKL